MKVGILGGGGCFALNFARHLSNIGVDHFGIGRSRKKEPAFWCVTHNYNYHQAHLGTQLQATLGILDTERPDVIVNYAAQGEGAASFADNAPDFFQTNCVALSKLVCELRKRSYLRRFVHIGSSEVYGASPRGDLPSIESDPLFPSSPYSASKAAFDWYLETMWRTARFPMNIVRPSNCYVEGQQLYRIIPKTFVTIANGETLDLHGGGKSEKSYLHADDLSAAVALIIDQAPMGEIFNVGPSKPISICNLVKRICDVAGVDFNKHVREAPDRVGQDRKYWLDSSKLRELGWSPRVPLIDGLQRMKGWVDSHPKICAMPSTYRHRP